MYIKRTYYSYAVFKNGKLLREFASYSEAREYITNIQEENENG